MGLSFKDSLNKAKEKEAENKALLTSLSSVLANAYSMDEEVPVVYDVDGLTAGNWTVDSRYDYYTDYADDGVSTIDDGKNVAINPKQFNITQEENSQYIPFVMPRYYDGFDLSTVTLSIHYETSDKYHGVAAPVNVMYDSDEIKFGWLLDSKATHVEGKLLFEVHATGVNSKGKAYNWKTKTIDKLTVSQSLCVDCDSEIDLTATWVEELVTRVAENVANKIADAQVGTQVEVAENAALRAETAASNAESAVTDALVGYATKTYVDNAVAGVDVSEQLNDYALKTYVDEKVAGVDVSEQLKDYAKSADVYSKADADAKIAASLEGYATDEDVASAIEAADISGKLNNYYKKTETYSQGEIDEKIANVTVDLTGYATETYVDNKTSGFSSSIAENASGITALNKSVADINDKIAGIDDSPRVTYEATYGDIVDEATGETQEYMFTLWETEGEGEPSVKSRFQIMGGGGGTGGSVTLRIAYVDGYTTPLVSTINDSVIVKYEFSGEDSAGDTNLDGTASWRVGNRVVATQDVSTGVREFDLTEYVNVGDNKVVLTITHATGAVATKAWTVKVVDVRLASSFNDAIANTAGQTVNFTFTPYGSIAKTVHFLLDGKEIAAKTSSAAAAGLSDSYAIPAQSHGTHLFEVYMTANVNGKTVESNHIVKDIMWVDEESDLPLIGCIQQKFTARQYEAVNILYTVYDPSTETPSVSLKSTYMNADGETVEKYSSNLVLKSGTQTWQYKTDVIGEHTLTITCGETVKTLVATIVELGIDVSPITTGLAFDFNPVGYSNDDANRLWVYKDTGIGMTVSDNFDWVNGGYQIDANGDQCFCIKAGTSAEINYELFGDDAKSNGKEFKLIFKTENVADGDTTFLSCVSDTMGTDKVGIDMKAHEATIYAKTDSLPLPYAEEEIIEFEFNITPSSETPSMIMGYEDGVSTRPLVYDATHDLQQHKDHRMNISLGSDDCDLYVYRFKVYNTSLSDRDILNNFIADARSAEEMIDRYDRNQIYQDGILTPEYLAEVCPQLRIIKIEAPWFTNDKKDKVSDTTIECIYKNGDPILDNWVATGCLHSGQGTSSNNYGASGRNLDLIMKKDKTIGNTPVITLGDGSKVSEITLTRESIPVNYLNLKVNIASSENANNALLQRRYNDYNPYKRPFVREDESIIPYIKDTMEFHNCVVFIKENNTDLSTHREFADNAWHFYAIGSVGDSKKTDKTRLTDQSDPYECILEVMDNTLPLSAMPTGKVDSNGVPIYPVSASEFVAGNTAYDALYGETFEEASAEDKANGLDDTYGWRYIYEDGTEEENATARAYVEGKWREFYTFIVTSTDEDFKARLGDYCVLDSVLYYYMFTLRYTLTDNHGKNSFWHYGKSNDVDGDGNQIRKWDLSFDYDNDGDFVVVKPFLIYGENPGMDNAEEDY